jgi:hypothetical protein
MIGHISSNPGPWLNGASSPAHIPTIYDNNKPMQGVMRVVDGKMQAWDGSEWKTIIPGTAYIDLSEHAKRILAWAEDKMADEARIDHLAKQHPAVADALALVATAQEKLKIVVALTQENKNEMV